MNHKTTRKAETMPTLQAPWPATAEYGDIEDAPRSRRTVVKIVDPYTLYHGTAGYEPAGSMARWANEYWSVERTIDGARHGHRFSKHSAAAAELRKRTGDAMFCRTDVRGHGTYIVYSREEGSEPIAESRIIGYTLQSWKTLAPRGEFQHADHGRIAKLNASKGYRFE